MPQPDSSPLPAAGPRRLLSLDALRGLDMFWIIGADVILSGLRRFSDNPVTRFLADQFEHKDWEGFAFYDLIFPLFVFIVGVSLVFSLQRLLAEHGPAAAVKRILRRAALLYLLGLFYYGGLGHGLENVRLLGVLQRIALCYLFAGLAFVSLRLRGLIVTCVALLAGYWALMCLVPVPGVGAGHFAEGQNLANYIDRLYLPLFKWDGDHDPEGLLSTLPAIANCLLGVFAGVWLRQPSVSDTTKVRWLFGAGAASVALGWLWGLQFPVIKKLWTSSYVLVASGYSAMLLAGFHQVIEVWKLQRWARPFVWIGMNPITIYLAFNVVDFSGLANRLVGGPVKAALGRFGELAVSAVVLTMSLLLARFLHRRKIFLRL